jgi:hypothetical protein
MEYVAKNGYRIRRVVDEAADHRGAVACWMIVPASAMGSSSPYPSLPHFPSKLIVLGRSIGGVSVDESTAKAIKAWGGSSRGCAGTPKPVECIWGDDANGTDGTASISLADGRVVRITLQLNASTSGEVVFRGPMMKLKTKQGIGLKSSTAQLEKLFPGQIGANEFGYTLGKGAHTTTFATSGGEFVTIDVGTPPDA